MREIDAIEQLVSNHFNRPWHVRSRSDSSGRRKAELLTGPEYTVFAKFTNEPNGMEKASCEAEALRRMAALPGVRAASVIGTVKAKGGAVLLLEAVQVQKPVREDWYAVAEMVASLHEATNSSYGLDHDNYIGDFKQSNPGTAKWSQFYAESRLRPMLERLQDARIADGPELSLLWGVIDRVDEISGPVAEPSLLHGDLWPGNVLFDAHGPILIDPAISYGNREMDLAFSQMAPHLSFDSTFYARYQERLPLPADYEFRKELWQLWPLLAHALQDGRKWMPKLLAAAAKYR